MSRKLLLPPEVLVKVISIDRQGKIRLSRKEAVGQTPDVVHNLRS